MCRGYGGAQRFGEFDDLDLDTEFPDRLGLPRSTLQVLHGCGVGYAEDPAWRRAQRRADPVELHSVIHELVLLSGLGWALMGPALDQNYEFVVGAVDFHSDATWALKAPGVEEKTQAFAESIGRYSQSDGPFDVAWAYGDRTELQSYYNTNRLWGAFDKVSPSLKLQPAMPYATRPVWVVPDHRVTRQDIMAIDRYHYEGTAIDQTQGYTLMSPHAQTNRPICYSTTDYSAVWQSRSWLPAAVGGVVWIAPSRPCSSAFVPFYAGITSVPAAWTSKTAYGAFRAVADSLDKNGTVGGQIRYKYYSPLVRSTYGAFETEVTNAQASTEATASGLSGAAQSNYLTNYSSQRATQAYNLALSLPAQMP